MPLILRAMENANNDHLIARAVDLIDDQIGRTLHRPHARADGFSFASDLRKSAEPAPGCFDLSRNLPRSGRIPLG